MNASSKWYTKPWALVVMGVIGGILAMGILAPEGNADASEQSATQEAPASSGEQAEEAAVPEKTEPAIEEAVEEQAAPSAEVAEKDSLANQDAVQDSRANIVELREDISDMQHDLNKGNVGWAGMNMTEITFNVSQLQVEEMPPSIADEWNALVTDLTTTNDSLISAYEVGSISQMQAALNSMSSTLDQMDSLLSTW
jgi:hypothetical protein